MTEAGSTAGFTRVGEETLYTGYIISHGKLTIETPDGDEISRDVIHHPGAVAVVAVHDGKIPFVRQYRAPFERTLIELPAGKLDIAGEALEVAANRELIEEVGFSAGTMVQLCSMLNSPGFCDEETWVFLGTDLTEVGRSADGVEEAHMDVLWYTLAEALALVDDGTINDAKTVIGLRTAAARGVSADS